MRRRFCPRGAVACERVRGVRQREPNSDGTRQVALVLVMGHVLSLELFALANQHLLEGTWSHVRPLEPFLSGE